MALSVVGATLALLPACGIRLPFLGTVGFCATTGAVAAEARLRGLDAANADLHQRIASLERELGAVQCLRQVETPAAAPPAMPEADTRDWSAGDLARLEGCWTLDSPFQTTNDRTGVTSHYGSWQMCFGTDGSGTEEMRADTGATCSGAISGMLAGGELMIEEPGNLQCDDGAFIYRLVSRCTPVPDGTAVCQVQQPDLGSSATVSFRRAERDN